MLYRLLADLVVVAHFAFVMFVVLGGLLVARWPRLVWFHLPAAAWGAWIEVAGWICPLTPLENWLRRHGGGEEYRSGFVEEYLLPILYPGSLTREVQWGLGAAVVVVNAVIYAWVARRHRRRSKHSRSLQP